MGRALLLQGMVSAAPHIPWIVGIGRTEAKAQPYTLQPILTAGSLGMVPSLFRALTTAIGPRDSTQASRHQTYALDALLLSFPDPGALMGGFTGLSAECSV